MKNLLILFIFFQFGNGYSQTQNISYALDKRNGFKNFTFGDIQTLYQNSLKKVDYLFQVQAGVLNQTTYFYYNKANEPKDLFGIEWEKIALGFTRNKLTSIIVEWNNLDYHFNKIANDLEEVFGKPEKFNSEFGKSYIWRGKDIMMELKTKPTSKNDKKTQHGLEYTLSLTSYKAIRDATDKKKSF